MKKKLACIITLILMVTMVPAQVVAADESPVEAVVQEESSTSEGVEVETEMPTEPIAPSEPSFDEETEPTVEDSQLEEEVVLDPTVVYELNAVSEKFCAIELTWNGAAKEYQIYRATSLLGKFKKIKTTTSTEYINTGLTAGKTYYYKVRCKNGTKYGSFSPKIKCKVISEKRPK